MTKGINLLELLFAVFLVLSIMDVSPFNNWPWWQIIGPLVINGIIKILKLAWTNYGLDKLLYAEVENAKYEVLLRREVRRAKKQIKNKQF